MKFEAILHPVLDLWPERIPLDDHRGPLPCSEGHDDCKPGHLFPELSRVWGDIEDEIGSDDPWRELMVWTLYQEFHAQSIRRVRSERLVLETRWVSREAIERRYRANLATDGWTRLLPSYEGPADPEPAE